MKTSMFLFFGKNGYHTISIYESCMTSFFFDGDNSNFFQNKIETPPKFFVFFQPRIEFLYPNKHFPKTILCASFIFFSA